MKQILQSYRTGELKIRDVPAPALDKNQVLVRTAFSVVSAGTERMVVELAKKSLLGKARARPDLVKKVLHKIKTEGLRVALQKTFAKLDTPVALGYSSAGVVVECGRNVHEVKPGDRVACGGAGYASHAEYVAVPRNLCVKLPQGVGFEDGAFATLGAIALQGVRQADVRLGERVGVVGLGLLGQMTVQLLKASGCKVLGVDLDPARCALAERLGADMTSVGRPVEAALALSDGYGLDALLLTASTASNQPIEAAADMLRLRGRVVVVGVVGMQVPRDAYYQKELQVLMSRSYGPGRYDPEYEERGHDYPYAHVRWTEQRNMRCVVELIAAGKLTPQALITHRFPIENGLEAYSLLGGPSGSYLGITLSYDLPQVMQERVALPRRVELGTKPKREGVGIGLIGAGGYAKGVLLPALHQLKDVRLAGICTATGSSSVETGTKHGFGYATTDPGEILKDEAIDAVLICTRHDAHSQLVQQTLRAGKHVLVEKPLCVAPSELTEIEDLLRELGDRGPVLAVGFNRRFSPHTQAVLRFFAGRTQPLVVTYRVNAGRVPLDSWLQNPDEGGGRIVGEVCHFVDWCRAVIGASPIHVAAASAAPPGAVHSGDDNVSITLSYADGSLATIAYLSEGSAALAKERIEVHCGGRSATLDDFRRTEFFGGSQPALDGPQKKGVPESLQAFLAAIAKVTERLPTDEFLETTRVTHRIVDALRRRPAT